MPEYALEITLLSDTTFNMGAGVAGIVDAEIQQDALGLPILSGRAIKGLLVNECSEILYALPEDKKENWKTAASRIFGQRGETHDGVELLHIGTATIAPDLCAFLAHEENRLSRQDTLDALTSVRRQTAINEVGAPDDETLRASRTLIHGLTLYSPLIFSEMPNKRDKALLAACAFSLRRAGLGRTRGKGKIRAQITNRPLDPEKFCQTETEAQNLTADWFDIFKKEVSG